MRSSTAEIVTVRPTTEVMTRQRLPYFVGISGESDTEPAFAIVSRNDPNEQENVIPYDPRWEAD